MNPNVQAALRALQEGRIVLVYDADGREEEVDIVAAGPHVSPDVVRTMRMDAGGLVCTAIGPEIHQALGLPFAADLLADAARDHPVLAGTTPDDIRYDPSKSSFGVTINHRDTFTGITDEDRSLTITALAAFATELAAGKVEVADFGARFRAPGHVQLLNGAVGGLATRQGHTELSLELARMAGLPAVTTVCEMMDPVSGRALTRKDAEAYAARHDLVFLTGQDILDAWQNASKTFEQPVAAPALTSA
ncbi:MAG: 3,4-dihydroxy-2-butanone-4-phosphate synthase [Thermoplasmatota archaeon]